MAKPQPPGAGSAPPTPAQSQPSPPTPRDHLDQLVRVTRPRLWIGIIGLCVVVAGIVAWSIVGTVDTTVTGQGLVTTEGGARSVVAPTAGQVTAAVRPGTHVERGQVIARITSDSSGQTPVTAPVGGTVLDVPVVDGSPVEQGEQVAVLAVDGPLSVVAFVPLATGKTVVAGMPVQVSPATVPSAQYGTIVGSVAEVSPYPVSAEEIADRLDSEALAEQFTDEGAALEITVSLTTDPATPTGLAWTSGTGPSNPITVGTPAEVTVITSSRHPISTVVDQ